MKRVLILAVTAFYLVSGAAAYCWENAFNEDPRIETVEGRVSNVDVQRSRITIKSVDTMTFLVPLNARVVQDIYDMKLSDVKAGDYVTIDYLDDPSGKHEAKTITVHYEKGEGV